MDYQVSPVPGKQLHLEDAHRRGLPAKVNGVRFGYSDKAGALLSEPIDRARVQMFVDASPEDWRVWDIAERRWIDWQPTPPPPSLDEIVAKEKARLAAEAKPPTDPSQAYLLEFRKRYEAASDKASIPADELKRALYELGQPARPDATREELLAAYEKAAGTPSETESAQQPEAAFLAEFAQKVQGASGDLKKIPYDELKKALTLLRVVYNPSAPKAELFELYQQATA
ncbi:hypothetical protein [Meiothermus sp. Pnk-1]|uniref:hypothetical protein n=1 Tax=Meiothermus sp. Pnk-1 TaxID=873128 RepID=UPI000D7D04E3|nr:hypothetical protein [Meiothermus sp. Pnk-1]PZA08311.1 hypothetical protein DNA98_04020 [Meiothermus sp. Pnk-1]